MPLTLFEFITREMNKCAAANGAVGSVDVIMNEMIQFHSMTMIMSLVVLPGVEYYFRKFTIDGISFLDLQKYISRRRFYKIKRYYHCNDNTMRPTKEDDLSEHRLWPILPIIKELKKTFKTLWQLSVNLTIDKQTIPTRNPMCPMRTYNKDKSDKFGVTVWQLCQGVSYFCWHFIVYDKV